ncbi:MAG: hypothetical protein CM1200mP15_17670 [Dehalococcoidia bacterium]|nr:MAG: hypothetical protein CM1200mP15_17670 [Dehalococcoidia bacterium]
MGLERPIASGQMSYSYIHELLCREFGIDFRQGGDLSGHLFPKPVYAGDTVTGNGIVEDRRMLMVVPHCPSMCGWKTRMEIKLLLVKRLLLFLALERNVISLKND